MVPNGSHYEWFYCICIDSDMCVLCVCKSMGMGLCLFHDHILLSTPILGAHMHAVYDTDLHSDYLHAMDHECKN